ncbi:MAG: L-aspartate oxidase [Candidatus Marinimicrobia bacterium]|nr:L-aspartate oxidase [Candidatus Neomarinimicrobiota bacterium]
MSDIYKTDVLIIGSGIGGATAALELAQNDIDVLLVTRAQEPEESNTYYAQGGIIYRGENDSPECLAEDLFKAGAEYNNPIAVQCIVKDGSELVKKILIDKLQVPFDRNENGDFSLIKEGAHTSRRILHTVDITGMSIEIALLNTLKTYPNVTILTGHTAIDLLTPSHHSNDPLWIYKPQSCVSAYVLNQQTGEVIRCLSKNTILATGGLGDIFLMTSNPKGSRGDGLAMAYRASARVINCEFIQFHPTTFFHRHAPNFLISEAVRGAGARLVDSGGEPFMKRFSPEWKDLAPRDIVARGIHTIMVEQDLTNVYLDLTSYMSATMIKNRFPTIYNQLKGYNVDITTDLVPVVPAAHYFCGGVWVDGWGCTTISDLYAVGEVSCTGVHGANRLGSASLLEGLVWGYRAAQHIMEKIQSQDIIEEQSIPEWQFAGGDLPDMALIQQDMSSIKHIMWNYVGLIRNPKRLERAWNELRNLEFQIEQFYRMTRITDGLIGLRNAVRSALIVTAAAWANKKSIGCHYLE